MKSTTQTQAELTLRGHQLLLQACKALGVDLEVVDSNESGTSVIVLYLAEQLSKNIPGRPNVPENQTDDILGGRMLGFTITELVRIRQLLIVLDVTVDELLERHGISRKGMSQNG